MSETNHVQKDRTAEKEKTITYSITKALAWILFHTLAPVRYHGTEHLKREAPFMLIANHQDAMDPIILAVPVKQQITFLAKKELMSSTLARKYLTALHCIPVDRHNRDMQAMRSCVNTLKQKRVLGIFPEGTRHHEGQMETVESGTALIALRTGVPLIPAWIPEKFRFFHINHCWIGEEIPTSDLREKGLDNVACEALTKRIKDTYRAFQKKL